MNRKTRLIIAAIVTLILAVTATTVWAGSNTKQGSLKDKIHELHGSCNGGAINMGDATFEMIVKDKVVCTFDVVRTKVPNAIMGNPPEDTEYRSDGFTVTGGPENGIGMLEVCFAHSPQDEEKNAQIYALFGNQTAVLPSVKTGTPLMQCAATPNLNGVFALIGNP